MTQTLASFAIVLYLSSHAFGGVGDVTIKTDHPQYAGEGAFQTPNDCVTFATQGAKEPQDKAIAMYLWFLTHQWHLMSPMEWSVPGRVPDSAAPGDYETVVFDANRGRFSYGYGLCGTVHAWNEVYWKALGMPARRREFPQHTNSEIYYGKQWHAFDTDMAGLLFRHDGVVAGYHDLQVDPTLADSVKSPLPHYPFAWPEDFNTMKAGWLQVAKQDSWYRLYNGGYAAHPGIVMLRSGESFTRWYDRDHFGGPEKRRFWHHQSGGPHRQWTYFGQGQPRHKNGKSNARGEATYCNGVFIYEPALSQPACREGMSNPSNNTGHRFSTPHLHSIDGQPAIVTFKHFSPYVICGDPEDDANPMSGKATHGMIIEGRRVGKVLCEISADEGQTWSNIDLAADSKDSRQDSLKEFAVDLTDVVKGRYGWHIRFMFRDKSGLDRIKFTTTTQVSQAMYPQLTPNGCNVDYRSTQRTTLPVLPNFGLPESNAGTFEVVPMRSENIVYQQRSVKQRCAYQATDNTPCHIVLKVNAPTPLTEVRAAIRYQLPVPPPEDCDIRLAVSTDKGSTWSDFAVAEISPDNEFSSGWLAGTVDVAEAFTQKALVRVNMHTPGRRAALIDAQLYGIHRTLPAGPVSVEFGWFEGDQKKTHTSYLPPKVISQRLQIPTGSQVQDSYIRIRALN